MRAYPGLIRRSFVTVTLLMSAQALDALHDLRAMEVEVAQPLDQGADWHETGIEPTEVRMRDTTKCATDSECEEARIEQCIADVDITLPDDVYTDVVTECGQEAE